MGMKWQALVVGALVCSLVSAQVPAVPPGGVKPVPKKSTKPVKDERARVLERAQSMRKGISTGKQLKSHVKVRVRLQNGNRLTGVVKDGRLVERVDGLRFVDAQALDTGAGIRLWYSSNTRSYIFIPFVSLKSYEVVQRLSAQQLFAIEKEMQMSEKRAKERAAKAQAQAQAKAKAKAGGGAPVKAPATLPGKDPIKDPADRMAALKGFSTQGSPVAKEPSVGGAVAPLGEAPAGGSAPPTTTPAAEKAAPVTSAEVAGELKEAKQELVWANLLRSYPPKDGWNEAKKNEIASRMVVVGALPSKFELEFVKKFDMWMAACEHNGIDPNIGVVKKPQTKREQRRAERARIRGQ